MRQDPPMSDHSYFLHSVQLSKQNMKQNHSSLNPDTGRGGHEISTLLDRRTPPFLKLQLQINTGQNGGGHSQRKQLENAKERFQRHRYE